MCFAKYTIKNSFKPFLYNTEKKEECKYHENNHSLMQLNMKTDNTTQKLRI